MLITITVNGKLFPIQHLRLSKLVIIISRDKGEMKCPKVVMRCRNFNKVLFVGDAGKCWVEIWKFLYFGKKIQRFDVKSLKNAKIAFKND